MVLTFAPCMKKRSHSVPKYHVLLPSGGGLVDRWPAEWIEQALHYSGKASIRRRRLPAEQVVWLVIALAMYRHLSIKEILDDLDLAPDLNDRCVASSGVSQAK